jgi:hypothetical protein
LRRACELCHAASVSRKNWRGGGPLAATSDAAAPCAAGCACVLRMHVRVCVWSACGGELWAVLRR